MRSDCVFTVEAHAGSHVWKNEGFAYVDQYAESPTGDHLAFVAQDRDGWHVVVDGVLGPAFEGISKGPAFSLDGRHVAYVGATESLEGHVMVDGKEALPAPMGIDQGAWGFTSDGRYVVAIRTSDGGLEVVVGGAKGPRFDSVIPDRKPLNTNTDLQLATSLTGGHYAYTGTRGSRRSVVVDGRETPLQDGLFAKWPLFSPAGSHLLYQVVPARPDSATTPAAIVVVDGVTFGLPGAINSMTFLPGDVPFISVVIDLGMGTHRSIGYLLGVDPTTAPGLDMPPLPLPSSPNRPITAIDEGLNQNEIDVQADGVVTVRGRPVGVVHGRRAPDVAR